MARRIEKPLEQVHISSNNEAPEIPRTSFASWLNRMVTTDVHHGQRTIETRLDEKRTPDMKMDEKDVDALLARELNDMSMKERNAIYEEIHGVDKIVDETPEFVSLRLAALEEELQRIAKKPAYEQAERASKQYVTDRRFRLMFLRSEHFDPQKAAIRLVKFMEEKKKLFGAKTLTRPLFLSDLSKDDMVCLKSGALQALPARDSAGRAMLGNFRNLIPRSYKEVDNMLRTLTYLMLTSVEEEETQKRGLVNILYILGNIKADYNRELVERANQQKEWLPVRVNSLHICFNDPLLRTLEPIVLLKLGREHRARVRMHYGTHTECRYSLMTFGIPVQFVPVSYEGQLKTAHHLKWMAKRGMKDLSIKRSGQFEGIDLPARNDVLLGRGKPFQEHPGNICMRNLVELYLKEYQGAPIGQKNVIAGKIVAGIQEVGGRFVKKRADGWWEETEDGDALVKVLKTFRTLRASSMLNPGMASRSVQMDNSKRAKIQQTRGIYSCLGFPCGAEPR